MTTKNKTGVLSRELAELGRKVQEALVTAASSDEVKAIKTELSDSLGRVGEKIVAAAKKAEETAKKEKIKEQARKVAKAGVKATEGIQKNLAGGLREVSARLAELAKKLDGKK
ncbi:MAG: hypothetical protein Q7R35_16355 [Elusimicrobiota bacterium]|nr:hypothetical protein [Elusimicrobiota bacterium]